MTAPLKMLTVRQPWASLIALGVKSIETRSWSTSYRGPFAIHAGAAHEHTGKFLFLARIALKSGQITTEQERPFRSKTVPFGAVVAVADLVDVVPMVGPAGLGRAHDGRWLETEWSPGELTLWDGEADEDMSDELPFGDFTPGRFAWLLDNVRAIDPVPAKGHQGLRDVPADLRAALGVPS